MSDQTMTTQVRVNTTSDTSGIDTAIKKVSELDVAIKRLTKNPIADFAKSISESVSQARAKVDASAARSERTAMAAISARAAMHTKAAQAGADLEAKAARSRRMFDADDIAAFRARMGFQAREARQRTADDRVAAQARRMFASEDVTLFRTRMAVQSEAARKQAQDIRDLARAQASAAREAAQAAKAQAREQTAAIRNQIGLTKELERERNRGTRDVTAGVGRVRRAVVKGTTIGAVGGALVGAGAKRGVDKLTQSGVGIDEAMTQSMIHIFGTQSTKDARKSAEDLRKKLMPKAVGLGTKTSELLSAYVEASQAGVDNDILDKVTDYGAKYAKMNKLSLPNTLEETGYALQGMKAFGPVNDKTVSEYFNSMSYLVATTAANREQMSTFGKKGLAAGASVGMSLKDTLAFGGAATAAGAEGSQASRMLSSQGGRIAGWGMKARDIGRKQNRTDEDKLFLQAPQMMGMGNYQNLTAKFKKDFFGTFAEVQEGLKKVADPLKRRSIEKMLFGQEFGAITDSMIMGGNLRQYRQKLDSPEANNFIDQNWSKQAGSFGFIIDQIKSVVSNLIDSLGLALKPLYTDLRDWIQRLPASFDNIEQSFKAGLDGFLTGLGSPDGSLAGLLKAWLGNPEDFQVNASTIRDFAKGFGEGLRTVGETIRKFMSLFTGGDQSAEKIGKLAAEFMGFSVALMAVAPVISLIGAIGAAILGVATIIRGAMGILRAAGVVGSVAAGGAGAAGAGAGAAAAGAAARGKGLLGKVGGALGVLSLAEAAQAYGVLQAPDGKKSFGRNVVGFLDPGLESWLYGDKATPQGADAGATQAGPDPKASSTPWVDPPARSQAQSGTQVTPAANGHQSASTAAHGTLVGSLDSLRAAVLVLTDAIANGGAGGAFSKLSIGKSKAEEVDLRAIRMLEGMLKPNIARAAATGSVSKAMSSGGGGIDFTPGAGGAGLSRAFSV